jgi:hypothetical protein
MLAQAVPLPVIAARIDSTGMSGTLNGSWESTGAGQAAGVLAVQIQANPTD